MDIRQESTERDTIEGRKIVCWLVSSVRNGVAFQEGAVVTVDDASEDDKRNAYFELRDGHEGGAVAFCKDDSGCRVF